MRIAVGLVAFLVTTAGILVLLYFVKKQRGS